MLLLEASCAADDRRSEKRKEPASGLSSRLSGIHKCDECGKRRTQHKGYGKYSGYSYCKECWSKWLCTPEWCPSCTTRTAMVVSSDVNPLSNNTLHYDFIEVGTSDWGTLTQFCAGDKRNSDIGLACQMLTADLYNARGLAIEPVIEYLAALPDLPRVLKLEAALDEQSRSDVLYCVSGFNTEKHMGMFLCDLPDSGGYEVDVMWYAKSLSSLSVPHPDLELMLKQVQRLDLLETRHVQVLCWAELCKKYNIGSVDVVKLDCEGKDCAILRGLLAHCKQHPAAFPRLIKFEANYLTEAEVIKNTLAALLDCGYKVAWQTDHNVQLVFSA